MPCYRAPFKGQPCVAIVQGIDLSLLLYVFLRIVLAAQVEWVLRFKALPLHVLFSRPVIHPISEVTAPKSKKQARIITLTFVKLPTLYLDVQAA